MMRRHRASRLWMPLVACLLAGCAGTPTTYLELAAIPPSGISAARGGGPVVVSRVAIPASMDRSYLTTVTGATTLHVAGHTRWAAPIGGMMRLVLAQDLASRLPDETVLMPGDEIPEDSVREVRINIQRFMPDQRGTVTLDADWSILSVRGRKLLAQGRFHVTTRGGVAPPAEAETMSVALGRLADSIAAKT
jgi:uncharacterized protein